jgi:hypothetical protein
MDLENIYQSYIVENGLDSDDEFQHDPATPKIIDLDEYSTETSYETAPAPGQSNPLSQEAESNADTIQVVKKQRYSHSFISNFLI